MTIAAIDIVSQPSVSTTSTTVELSLLATSDIHMHLLGFDYFRNRSDENVGLARVATLIRNLRETAQNCLLFDVGDLLQGTPMADYLASHPWPEKNGLSLHPAIAAMNTMRYDAATLGNHEFDAGLMFLKCAILGANFPFTVANLELLPKTDPCIFEPIKRPFVILDRTVHDTDGRPHPLRVGVIGFAPPQTNSWNSRHLASVARINSIPQTAQIVVPQMRAAGADIIVALCHGGIGTQLSPKPDDYAGLALSAVDGIDVMLAGHSHGVFPDPHFDAGPGVDVTRGTLNGIPTVLPGCFGSHLGHVDLTLRRTNGTWRVRRCNSQTHSISDTAKGGRTRQDPKVIKAVQRAHEQTLAYAHRPIATAPRTLHSFFDLIAPSAAQSLIATAQLDHMAHFAKNTEFADLPCLVAQSPFKNGGKAGPDYYTDIPKGPLRIRHIADLYHHVNQLRLVTLTGAEIVNWLERSASIFNRLSDNDPNQPLLNAHAPPYHFDTFYGLECVIDLSKPAAFDIGFGTDWTRFSPQGRISSVTYRGQVLDPDQTFLVSTHHHRISGSSGFAAAAQARVAHSSTRTIGTILTDHLIGAQRVDAPPISSFSFAPNQGRSALFTTSPKARTHMADAAGLMLQDLGNDPLGFAQFRLHF